MSTRLYMRFAEDAAVVPAYDGDWDETGSVASRRLAQTRSASDTLAQSGTLGWTAGNNRLHRQLVGDPMAAGVDFGGVLVRGIIRCIESNADDNARVIMGLRVVSIDGIPRATLLAVGQHGAGTEISAVGSTAIDFAAEAVCAAYTTQYGDRLALELGGTDTAGTTPTITYIWGSSATSDLNAVGETTNRNPWIDFNITIPFLALTAGSVQPYTVSPYTVRTC